MLSKTSIAILAASAIFGAASAAQAGGSRNDAGTRGGSDIGPLGQCFMPPDCDADLDQQGINAYAYGPGRYRYARRAYGYAPGAYAYARRGYAYGRGAYAYERPYPPGWHYTLDYGWHYGPP